MVGEGVETEAQRDMLLAAGCDEFQGFFFARPMPPVALLAWLRAGQPLDGSDTPSHHRLPPGL
ncbi:Oxygen sensor protein DosP [compost metagenome]